MVICFSVRGGCRGTYRGVCMGLCTGVRKNAFLLPERAFLRTPLVSQQQIGAVNVDGRTGDIRGFVGAEEGYQARLVLWSAKPSQRDFLALALHVLRRRALAHHLG